MTNHGTNFKIVCAKYPESLSMNRRLLASVFALLLVGTSSLLALPVHAADEAPDTLIQRLTTEVLNGIKSDQSIQAGEVPRIVALVDAKLMPNVNFKRMTASAVGPAWRQATPEQQKRLRKSSKLCWYAPMRALWPKSTTSPSR